MKKIFMAIIALTVLASADYETFVSKTGNNGGSSSIVYFGEYKDFLQSSNEIKKYIAANGMQGALTGLTASSQALAQGLSLGAGASAASAGVIIAILDPYIMDLWADTTYYMIKKYSNGTFKKILLVSDTSMSPAQAKQIMNSK